MSDVQEWIADHKAAAAGVVGGTILIALLLYVRSKRTGQTASATDGTTGATVTGGGQYLVPYDGTADYASQSSTDLVGTVGGLTSVLQQLSDSGGFGSGGSGLLLPGGGGLPNLGATTPVPGTIVNPGPTTGATAGNGGQTGTTSSPGGGTTTGQPPVVAPTTVTPTPATPPKPPATVAPKPPAKPTVTPKPVSKPPAPKVTTYTVRKGDTLTAIAKSHHLSLKALEKLNPQIKNPNVIKVGQKIKV